jgi:hypothetical protein
MKRKKKSKQLSAPKQRDTQRKSKMTFNQFFDGALFTFSRWLGRTWFMRLFLRLWYRVEAIYEVARLWFTNRNKVYGGGNTSPAQLVFFAIVSTLGVFAIFWWEPTNGVTVYVFLGFVTVWYVIPWLIRFKKNRSVKSRIEREAKALDKGYNLTLSSQDAGYFATKGHSSKK